MGRIQILKNKLSACNPIGIYKRKKMRDRLINRDITLLTSNCMGGLILHDLNLPFLSPTIDLMIDSKEFIRLCLNLEYYLQKKLLFLEIDQPYPVARLEDITISFTHYSSREEAEYKWEERKKRINRDNLFILANDRDGVTKEDMQALQQISCRGIVVFSAHQYDDIPCSLYINCFEGYSCVGNMLKMNWKTGTRLYDRYFDYVKWFNESKGDHLSFPYAKR
jgi:uncharacterized protein (DUF1919 family)